MRRLQIRSNAKIYNKKVKEQVRKILAERKDASFEEILRNSKGVFPTHVYSLLEKNHELVSECRPKSMDDHFPFEESPANYEWRFNESTIRKLVKRIQARRYKKIALFGVPSLYAPLLEAGLNVYLFDINPLVKSFYENDEKIIISDLNHDYLTSFRHMFDCVILDPPWYLDYYRSWLSKANLVLKKNGDVYISLFQSLLRPDASIERRSILEFASRMGVKEVLYSYLGYRTPQFEKSLLEQSGICLNSDWRVADLLLIKDTSPISVPVVEIDRFGWVILTALSLTIAVKMDEFSELPIAVRYPYEGEDPVIRSVSDRDLVKKRINFITSRNYGLIVKGQRRIIRLLNHLGRNGQFDKVPLGLNPDENKEFTKILKVIKNEHCTPI